MYFPKHRYILWGGGTIALFLAQMAQMCDFEVHVFDDRKEFADSIVFHGQKKSYACLLMSCFLVIIFKKMHILYLMTRGHLNDEKCLKEVLQLSYAYVG